MFSVRKHYLKYLRLIYCTLNIFILYICSIFQMNNWYRRMYKSQIRVNIWAIFSEKYTKLNKAKVKLNTLVVYYYFKYHIFN